jgi:quercetin dioxygenase-like cupin family protein
LRAATRSSRAIFEHRLVEPRVSDIGREGKDDVPRDKDGTVAELFAQSLEGSDFQVAWIESDPSARWRSASGHGPNAGAKASGSSLLEIEPGNRLPRHTDSAEETIVVVAGTAYVAVEDQSDQVDFGAVALIPAGTSHEVRNVGDGILRFVAVYADTDVVTTYEEEVQPDGSRERHTVG